MTARDPYRGALHGMRRTLVTALGFSAVVNVLMLTGAIYMLQVYDRVLPSGSVPTLLALFAIVVVLFGFLCFYDILRRRLLSRAAMRLDAAAGDAAFDLYLRAGLPAAAGAKGDARPLGDLETVRGFLSGGAAIALMDLPFVPIFLGALFVLHPWLGWLTLGGAGLGLILALVSRAVTRGPIATAGEAEIAERDFSDASRRGAEALAAMGMGAALGRRWRQLHDGTLTAGQAGADPSEVLSAASRAFRMLLQSGILTLSAFLVIRGEITAGMIIAASVLSGRALAPVDQITGQWRVLGRAHQAHRRLAETFANQPARPETLDLPAPEGRIAVAGLTKFAPGAAGPERARLLDAVGFALEPGDGLGVVGPSGSGKSTLARMLTGAWAADAGEVRLDGATLGQWSTERLGRAVGYLPQSVALLPGTIRDNIARFDPEATDEAVIEAARLSGMHEMILRLPEGYTTKVGGADGTPLSGGQLQRLGLARAVFGLPRLVVLDEPNANLDAAGDAALTRAISALRAAGSTVVVMAHRPSALAAVNRVLLLRGGRVERFGDKAEVLGANVPDMPPQRLGTGASVPPPRRRLPLRIIPGGPVADQKSSNG